MGARIEKGFPAEKEAQASVGAQMEKGRSVQEEAGILAQMEEALPMEQEMGDVAQTKEDEAAASSNSSTLVGFVDYNALAGERS